MIISLYAAYTILNNKRLEKDIPRTLIKRMVVSIKFKRLYFKHLKNNEVCFIVLKVSIHKNRFYVYS